MTQHIKATREDAEERVEMCVRLLNKGLYKGQIKSALIKQYSISARMSETYISRAKRKILAETNKTREEHQADAYGFLIEKRQTCKRDSDQLKAQELIIDLLALDNPKTVNVNGKVDSTVRIVRMVSPSTADPLDANGLRQRQSLNGHANGHANGDS